MRLRMLGHASSQCLNWCVTKVFTTSKHFAGLLTVQSKKGEVGFATTPFYTIALTLELSRRLNFISWSGWVHTSLKGSWTMGQQVRPSRQAFYFSSLKLKWRMANHGAERLEALQLRCKVVPHSWALLLTHCPCNAKWWRVRQLSGQRLAARVFSLGGISGYRPKGSGCIWKIA